MVIIINGSSLPASWLQLKKFVDFEFCKEFMGFRWFALKFFHIILFYPCSVQLELPRPLFDPNFFNAWMGLFLNILERPVPVEGQPEDPELRKSWGWWKAKKWIAHILNRLYTRYAGT